MCGLNYLRIANFLVTFCPIESVSAAAGHAPFAEIQDPHSIQQPRLVCWDIFHFILGFGFYGSSIRLIYNEELLISVNTGRRGPVEFSTGRNWMKEELEDG